MSEWFLIKFLALAILIIIEINFLDSTDSSSNKKASRHGTIPNENNIENDDKLLIEAFKTYPKEKIIELNHKLAIISEFQNYLLQSYRREFNAFLESKIEFNEQSSLSNNLKELRNIMSQLDQLALATLYQDDLLKNFRNNFLKKENFILNKTNQENVTFNYDISKQKCYIKSTSISKRLDGHSSHVLSLAMLPNQQLASGSADSSVLIWNIKDGELVKRLTGNSRWVWFHSLALLTNGNLAAASSDKTIIIWNVNNGSIIQILRGHTDAIYSIAVLHDDNLASGSADKTIKIWKTNDGSLKMTLKGHGNEVRSIALLKNGNLASGSNDKTVIIWNINDGSMIKKLIGHSGSIRSLAALPDGNLASGSEDKTIIIWNIFDGAKLKILKGHYNYVFTLSVLSNGNLASGSADSTIKIWNVNDGSLINTLSAHSNWVKSLVVLPNGDLVSASDDKTIIIWNTFCS